MKDDIRSGMLVLISHNILCKVEKTDERGWSFYCVNGAWSGYFDAITNVVKIDGQDDDLAATITSTAQPPDSVHHYNAIIPWMQERPL